MKFIKPALGQVSRRKGFGWLRPGKIGPEIRPQRSASKKSAGIIELVPAPAGIERIGRKSQAMEE
jgi:hypothetical protein